MVRSWFQWREEKGCYDIILGNFKLFNLVMHVFSFRDNKLSSNKGKLSSISINFLQKLSSYSGSLLKSVLQMMEHVEIMLNFAVETYFSSCNTEAKSNDK